MFDDWWKSYPRKTKKGDARKAWEQTADIRPPLADMLAALEWQCKQAQWRKDGGEYIPYPASYLRAEQWDDEPVKIQQSKPRTVYDVAEEDYQKRYGKLFAVSK